MRGKVQSAWACVNTESEPKERVFQELFALAATVTAARSRPRYLAGRDLAAWGIV